MNQNFTLPAFAEPITGLPDTPTCAADELKRRFQAPADEVREAHNALAEAHQTLDEKVEGIVTETFAGTIHESMFDEALAEKLNGKAEQTALRAEITARISGDTALQSSLQQKCEAYFGTYTGDGTENRVISLGFTPKAVLLLTSDGMTHFDGHYYGGLSITNGPIILSINGIDYYVLKIVDNGFQVTDFYHSPGHVGAESNATGHVYFYLAFK